MTTCWALTGRGTGNDGALEINPAFKELTTKQKEQDIYTADKLLPMGVNSHWACIPHIVGMLSHSNKTSDLSELAGNSQTDSLVVRPSAGNV